MENDIVRFNLHLDADSMSRLKKLAGRRSMAATVRAALTLARIVAEENADGRCVVAKRRDGSDVTRFVL